MIEVVRLQNQLLGSNCFILNDEEKKSCIVIDPGSEFSEREICYIEDNRCLLSYVILTHPHTDHCWGVYALKRKYPDTKLVYHEDVYAKREFTLFFRMWLEDVNYNFELCPADISLMDGQVIDWYGNKIKFVSTPGHSAGSVCISINDMLFTGDTIMPFPPYFNGRGSNKEKWKESVEMILGKYSPDTIIYPGHGEVLTLREWRQNEEWTKTK